MRYTISPLNEDQEVIDFGLQSSVVLSERVRRSGRTEIINILCEVLAGSRAMEDSRPNKRRPWTTSASILGYEAGVEEYHAIRYENGQGIEIALGDLPDASLNILGYSDTSKCGWYHADGFLSVTATITDSWLKLNQSLGLLSCIGDESFKNVINECLVAAGLPSLAGGTCHSYAVYTAEYQRKGDSRYLHSDHLTSTEQAGIMQVCSQVMPWLLHSRRCLQQGTVALETCYCLIDDLAPGVDLHAVHAVMTRLFPRNKFFTFAFV